MDGDVAVNSTVPVLARNAPPVVAHAPPENVNMLVVPHENVPPPWENPVLMVRADTWLRVPV